ncbi:MAG: hypothetical protein V2B13_17395 [Pseudomonadota bacterium]
MKRKKFWLVTLLLGLSLCLGGWTPARAGEMDAMHLINLLKKKGVITQEEANELINEVRSEAKKEKVEMTTAIKEDIKKDAGKDLPLPKGIKGFTFSSTIFGEYTAKSIKNGASSNDFNVNRAYITLKKEFTPWLDMRITTDLFSSKDADDKGNGLEVRMKYAYFNVKLFGTATEFGLVHTPSDDYDSSIWPYRVQGKHFLDNNGLQASADLGIVNKGTFGGKMDEEYLKNVSSAFSGKWGGYMVGLYNGAGYDNTEANTNKAVSGLVYVRPLPAVPVLKGLQLAYYGNYGKSNSNFTTPGKTTDYPDWQINIGQISLQHEMFALMGQYYWGKGAKTATEDNERRGYVGAGYLRIPGMKKLRLFGKYEYFDPNTNKSNDGYTTTIAGLSYDVTKDLMPFIAYEHRSYESSSGAEYDKIQIGFQLNF